MNPPPEKPWEQEGYRIAQIPAELGVGVPLPMRLGRPQPPPLPPRPAELMARSSRQYNNLFSSYGSYGMGGGFPGGYPFSGGFPSSYSPQFSSPFAQIADEASAGAFNNIESFVRALSSITFMMEGTYQALHMSFRTILGVIDNMSRVKSVVADAMRNVAIFKLFMWFIRKLQSMLRLVRGQPPVEDEVWNSVSRPPPNTSPSTPTWPFVSFIAILFGGPYLLYKMCKTQPSEFSGVPAIALFPFDATREGELPFKTGERLMVSMRQTGGGWALAEKDGRIGYVPMNRIKLMNKPKDSGADVGATKNPKINKEK